MADVRRVDAQRNRARILDVARDALTADPNVSLNAVAKAAGIGPGTLYRHFANREELLLAVYAQETDSLSRSVADSLAEHEPLEAFRQWSRTLARYVRIKHGMGDALASPGAQAVIDATYEPVTSAIQQLLDAAAARGDVRQGIAAADVLLLLSALWRVPDGPDGLVQADRILELIVDGLAARSSR